MRPGEAAALEGKKEKGQGDEHIAQDKQINGGGVALAKAAAVNLQEEEPFRDNDEQQGEKKIKQPGDYGKKRVFDAADGGNAESDFQGGYQREMKTSCSILIMFRARSDSSRSP